MMREKTKTPKINEECLLNIGNDREVHECPKHDNVRVGFLPEHYLEIMLIVSSLNSVHYADAIKVIQSKYGEFI